MFRGDRDNDTICAVSTPHGVGGISVIRISGPKTLSITKKICQFLPEHPESHKSYFGLLKDVETGLEIDEVGPGRNNSRKPFNEVWDTRTG